MSKQEEKEITLQTLNEDELRILDGLIKSPAWAILQKITDRATQIHQSALLVATDPQQMIRIQGRLLGISEFRNLPMMIRHQFLKIEERRKKGSEKKAG